MLGPVQLIYDLQPAWMLWPENKTKIDSTINHNTQIAIVSVVGALSKFLPKGGDVVAGGAELVNIYLKSLDQSETEIAKKEIFQHIDALQKNLETYFARKDIDQSQQFIANVGAKIQLWAESGVFSMFGEHDRETIRVGIKQTYIYRRRRLRRITVIRRNTTRSTTGRKG